MKNGTNGGALPPLISDVITDPKDYIDNLFADTWKKLKFNARIKTAGFTKRSGIEGGGEAASGFSQGANGHFRITHGIDTSVRHSLFDAHA